MAAFVLATISFFLVSTSGAQQSEACLNETVAIHTDATVLLCTTHGGSIVSCSYDFGNQSANIDATCSAAGGQMVTSSFNVTCTVNNTAEVTYVFTNAPNCIGESCDPTLNQDELMNFTIQIERTLDDTKGLEDCYFSPSSAPIIMGSKALLIISIALLVSAFLF
jgi:hypothetical protein